MAGFFVFLEGVITLNKLQAIDIWLSLQKRFPKLIITAHPHSNGDWYVKVQEQEWS
jgi:hypothetical protein